MKDKVFSKITMTLLLAMAANVGFANNTYKDDYKDAPVYKGELPLPCPSLNGGFYVGAQAGYEAFRVGQSLVSPAGSFSTKASLSGWLGGLFLGYGYYFNNLFYLGGEIFGNYDGADQVFARGADDNGDSFTRRLKAEGTWGLALIPGVKINDTTLGYIRLGYDWTRFQHSATFVNNDGPTFLTSETHTFGGFDFGIGLETLICNNLSIRTQFDHVWYNNRSHTVAPDVTSTTKPSNNQFTLGLLYHFA